MSECEIELDDETATRLRYEATRQGTTISGLIALLLDEHEERWRDPGRRPG